MTDGLEVTQAGILNIDGALRDPQQLHQTQGIALGVATRAEARHSHADDALAIQPEEVKGAHRHEQCQRRV